MTLLCFQRDDPGRGFHRCGMPWRESLVDGLSAYLFTATIVLAGAWFGVDYVGPSFATSEDAQGGQRASVVAALSRWDGRWYADIARFGYSYDPQQPSTVAFFPGYPLTARVWASTTGMTIEASLLCLSHLFFVCFLVVLSLYVRRRTERAAFLPALSVCLFALWPTTVFCRMAYSESLFLFVAVLSLYCMDRNSTPFGVSVLVGAATAIRLVGVALVFVFVLWLWSGRRPGRSRLSLFALTVLSCWGIFSYCLFLHARFGEPFAFSLAQANWRPGDGGSWSDYLVAMVTFRPLWDVYRPESSSFWLRWEPIGNPIFSLQFANPIWVGITAMLVAVGAYLRFLNSRESIYSGVVLLVPYIGHSETGLMFSQGRYAMVAFPACFVLAKLMVRLPKSVALGVCAVLGSFLGIYAALFAADFRIF